MSNILDFLENNYIWFLVAAAVLLFALVGFIVDSKRKQKKMEGNFETAPVNNGMESPINETPVVPTEPTMQMPVEEQPVATEEVKAPFEPITESPEVLDLNVNNTNEMTFNDIPTPQEPTTFVQEEPVKEEIIEPFNIGTPVEASNLNAEPVVEQPSVQEPILEQTPVNEPAVAPMPNTNITNDQEPVVNIPE